MKRITSPHNPRLKLAIKLRTRRGRKQHQRFLVDGCREVERFLRRGINASELFVCPELLEAAQLERLLPLADQLDLAVFELPTELFRKLAYGDRCEGVIAGGIITEQSLSTLPLGAAPLVVVVESIEKPGNLGAIVRTAEASGADAVVVAGQGTDLFHPNTIRTSTGAVFSLPVAQATSEEALRWLRSQQLEIYAARPEATLDYAQADLTQSCAMVLGAESSGLSDVWRGSDILEIVIPMQGTVDSLNVSVTAAIMMFEARRQRSQLSS